jgi:Fibronectin type III-like domain/Glycosyl hydrolase family 3 N terminal domain
MGLQAPARYRRGRPPCPQRNQDRGLVPALDIARTPLGGRQAEAFGEDPYLTGVLGAAYVRGVQRNVVAMVKHFVVNNFETGRTGSGWPPSDRGPAIAIRFSRRALEEIYFPPFRRALTGAGAGSVMGSCNQVNGCYACQNPDLLGTLKDQRGWAGFVAPDFGLATGCHSPSSGYEDLRIRRPGPGEIQVSFGIVNNSPRPGHEVAQLYLRCPVQAAEPPFQLKGFQRVHLKAGERCAVTFTLTPADLASWSGPAGWTVHPGSYEVLIGASSADVRLSAVVEVADDSHAR